MVKVSKTHPLFLTEADMPILELSKEDYEGRVRLLAERIRNRNLTHMLICGDREHFSNVEYFTHYDCRFEETLLAVDSEGACSIVVGNEGMGYSRVIPIEIRRYLYQNFSLQGQPRDRLRSLTDILREIGIDGQARIGVAGVKYFEAGMIDSDPEQTYDLPEYMMTAIRGTGASLVNATAELTGVPDGIRMRLYTAKEIAWAESAGNRAAAVMQRLLKNLKEGICDYELAQLGGAGFDPQNTHPLVNFGAESVAVGMGSPRQAKLKTGEVGGLCYSVRGNLVSRVGVMARGEEDYAEELKPYFESFYKKYYEAVAAWYEAARVGVTGGELYDAVMNLIGGEEFGVTLNPGHFTGTEEWSNAISAKGSEVRVPDGAFMQVDIIAHGEAPVRTGICEDAVVIAGEELRAQLERDYPEVYRRIMERRKVMREVLGIRLHEDVLPMSNLNGAYYPFMLNTDLVFAKE